MKHNLLGAVSTIALGAAFGFTPGAANAFILAGTALSCTGLSSGSCTETIPITASKENFSAGNGNQNISLDKWYAPQAGDVLTGVSYLGGGNLSSHGTLSNTGSSSAAGRDIVTMNLTLSGGTPSNFIVPSISLSAIGQSTKTTLAPGSSTPYTLSKALGPSSLVPLSSSLSGYIGPSGGGGLIHALATSTSSGGASASPATFSASQNILETAFVTITYNYTTPPPPPPPPSPTPEPASMALLGVGLAGLGAIRRRRKA